MPAKLGYGLVLLAIGFFVMVVASVEDARGSGQGFGVVAGHDVLPAHGGRAVPVPVGLSSVTKLAPRRLVGQMMGTFFMGNALGNLIAGLTAGEFSTMPLPRLFGTIAWATGGGGLILLLFSRPIRRLIGVLPREGRPAGSASRKSRPSRGLAGPKKAGIRSGLLLLFMASNEF